MILRFDNFNYKYIPKYFETGNRTDNIVMLYYNACLSMFFFTNTLEMALKKVEACKVHSMWITVNNLVNKLLYGVALNRYPVSPHIPEQKLCHLPCAVSTAWTALMRRRQLVSTYSMNTKRSLSAVFTTRRNLLAIKAYSHCTVSLCSITPFIPSTYSITCPSAGNKTVTSLLQREQVVHTYLWAVQEQYRTSKRQKMYRISSYKTRQSRD